VSRRDKICIVVSLQSFFCFSIGAYTLLYTKNISWSLHYIKFEMPPSYPASSFPCPSRETSDPGKISAEREDKIRFTFEMGQMVTSRL